MWFGITLVIFTGVAHKQTNHECCVPLSQKTGCPCDTGNVMAERNICGMMRYCDNKNRISENNLDSLFDK